MITISAMAADALGTALAQDFRRLFGSSHVQAAERLDSMARVALVCLGKSDALYHNVEHTLLVAQVARDILRGRTLTERLALRFGPAREISNVNNVLELALLVSPDEPFQFTLSSHLRLRGSFRLRKRRLLLLSSPAKVSFAVCVRHMGRCNGARRRRQALIHPGKSAAPKEWPLRMARTT